MRFANPFTPHVRLRRAQCSAGVRFISVALPRGQRGARIKRSINRKLFLYAALHERGLALERNTRNLAKLLDPRIEFFDGCITVCRHLGRRAEGGLVRLVRVGKGVERGKGGGEGGRREAIRGKRGLLGFRLRHSA